MLELPEDYVFEFRDETRSVPPHLAPFFKQLDCLVLTYDQAVNLINQKFMADRLQKAQDDALRQHFIRYPKS